LKANKLGILVRRATINDTKALCSGVCASFVPLLEQFYPDGYYPYFCQERWMAEKIRRDFVYVCLVEEKIAGGMIICKSPDLQTLKFHTVYVDMAFRRQGLAFFMLTHAESLHKNTKRWILETAEALSGNIALYEKAGYHKYGFPKPINQNVTILYYEKYTNGIKRDEI